MFITKRRIKLFVELMFMALLITLLQRQYYSTERSTKRRQYEDDVIFPDDECDWPPMFPRDPQTIPKPVANGRSKRVLKVRAIGLRPHSWYFGALKGHFEMCYSKGYIDKSKQCQYLPESMPLEKADAVIFRGTLLENPTAQKVINGTYGRRNPNQWWVFFDNEPPYKVWKYANLSNYDAIFNLTATYSTESDVPRVDLRRIKHCVRNDTMYNALEKEDFASRKKKDGAVVAWFASECNTQSKRENYVKELQKYIPVDIYGECGPLRCGSRELNTWATDKCHERLLHLNGSYKFYLSFENSFCKDYVTEKLWLLEKLDIIPIVMGGVDYANMMPKDSYIDVRDFSSPRMLARYLHFLNRHSKHYNHLLRNKNALDCYLTYPYMPWECKLCEHLHSIEGTKKVVYNLGRYWGRQRCLTPSQYFKQTPDHNFDD